MLIFTKGVKELLVTSGVLISCGLFVVYAICCVSPSVRGLIVPLFLLLPVLAVLRGSKPGYLVTRYFWTGVAFLMLFGCLLNPIAWLDADAEGFWAMGSSLLIFPPALCLSYCLSEHAKLREVEGAQKWRSLPLSLTWILLLLGAGSAGFVWLRISWSIDPPVISKQFRTKADILALGAQLGDYQERKGIYPGTEDWLQAIEWDVTDAWGNNYVYRYPGKRDSQSYDLFSAGPDGIADTADDEWGQ